MEVILKDNYDILSIHKITNVLMPSNISSSFSQMFSNTIVYIF